MKLLSMEFSHMLDCKSILYNKYVYHILHELKRLCCVDMS